jgi:hypothetical protein
MTAALLVALVTASDLSAQLPGQSFTVTPDSAAATVGDTVTVSFRVRLHERDQLLDSVPDIAGDLPPGIRILSISTLRRSEPRLWQGNARLAFYRPGQRPVPIFGVTFMRPVEGISRATLPSDSAVVEIRPVLPAAGNPSLKDIREIEPRPRSVWPWAGIALALAAATAVYFRRRRRLLDATVAEVAPAPEQPPARSAYQVALEQLHQIEAERWPAQGEVARHYEAVAQALRRYLEDAHEVGALERTTSELLWAMPPHLGRGGLRERCREVFYEADLVKFAEARPTGSAPAIFLERARALLTDWHRVGAVEEDAGALR